MIPIKNSLDPVLISSLPLLFMCPYLQKNKFSILAALVPKDFPQEGGGGDLPLPTPSRSTLRYSPSPSPSTLSRSPEEPTNLHAKVLGLVETFLGTAEAREGLGTPRLGTPPSCSLSEEFHSEPKAVAALLLQLEKTLAFPQFACKLLTLEAPQKYLEVTPQNGSSSFSFWAQVGYHEQSGENYGMLFRLGVSCFRLENPEIN